MHPISIQINNAYLAYKDKTVFTKLNLNLQIGRWTALLGPSGIGKSSLLRLIAGLTSSDEQSSIDIQTNSGDFNKAHVAYMSQTDSLLPWLTVLGNATLHTKLQNQSAQ